MSELPTLLQGKTPYEVLGREAIFSIAFRFYEVMAEEEPELAGMHRCDASGAVERELQERFALFLQGWLGGPMEYMQKHGHPRLRMRHGHLEIGPAERDAWMRCMTRALTEEAMPEYLRSYLQERFAHVAEFLRNRE